MRAIGKIGDIHVAYQQEKTSERDGSKYWAERYTLFVEIGDDTHMVDSGWYRVQGKDGGKAIMENKGIRVGAVGEFIIRYGFRDYNGKSYPECTLVKFTPMAVAQQAPAAAATSAPAQPEASAEEVAAGMAEAAEQAAAAEHEPVVLADGETSDLPF